jgi:esterase/lipase superfamily enzyme
MEKILVFLLANFLVNCCLAQSDIYDQDVQYNILIDSPQDSIIDVVYEIETTDENGENQIYQTASLDSFLIVLHNDMAHQDTSKNQLLFYIHGMWGGRRVNFNKAYKLLSNAYIEHEDSDIARIISLKWPGNKMEYKENKKTLYSISDTIAEVFLEFVEAANLGFDKGSRMDLMSHSLGTELFKEVIKYASEQERLAAYFDQVIIAAPDWDIDVWNIDSSLYNIQDIAERTHVYFSHRDMTLSISKNLNKQSRFGLDGPPDSLVLPPNVYAVDVTNVKDDNNMPDLMTGHNYYRASPIVTVDMLHTLLGYKPQQYNNRKLSEKYPNVYYLSMPDKENIESNK